MCWSSFLNEVYLQHRRFSGNLTNLSRNLFYKTLPSLLHSSSIAVSIWIYFNHDLLVTLNNVFINLVVLRSLAKLHKKYDYSFSITSWKSLNERLVLRKAILIELFFIISRNAISVNFRQKILYAHLVWPKWKTKRRSLVFVNLRDSLLRNSNTNLIIYMKRNFDTHQYKTLYFIDEFFLHCRH